MIGPKEPGFYTKHLKERESHYEGMIAGARYKVCREFVDADGETHPEGETLTFLGYSYLPMDEGYSFFFSLDGSQEWHIPLQRPEHDSVIDAFPYYFIKE